MGLHHSTRTLVLSKLQIPKLATTTDEQKNGSKPPSPTLNNNSKNNKQCPEILVNVRARRLFAPPPFHHTNSIPPSPTRKGHRKKRVRHWTNIETQARSEDDEETAATSASLNQDPVGLVDIEGSQVKRSFPVRSLSSSPSRGTLKDDYSVRRTIESRKLLSVDIPSDSEGIRMGDRNNSDYLLNLGTECAILDSRADKSSKGHLFSSNEYLEDDHPINRLQEKDQTGSNNLRRKGHTMHDEESCQCAENSEAAKTDTGGPFDRTQYNSTGGDIPFDDIMMRTQIASTSSPSSLISNLRPVELSRVSLGSAVDNVEDTGVGKVQATTSPGPLFDPVNPRKTSTPTPPQLCIPVVAACKQEVAACESIVSRSNGGRKEEFCCSMMADSTAAIDTDRRKTASSSLNLRHLPKSYTNPFVPTPHDSCLPFRCTHQVHNKTLSQTSTSEGVIGVPRGGNNNHMHQQQEGQQQLLCTPRGTRKGIKISSSRCDFSTFCNEDTGVNGCSSLSLTRDYSDPLFSSPSIVPGPTPHPTHKKATTDDVGDDRHPCTPFITPESSCLTWVSTKAKGEDAIAKSSMPSSVASSPHAISLTHSSSSLGLQDVEFRVEDTRHHHDDCCNEQLPSTSSQPREAEDVQYKNEYVMRLGSYDEGGTYSSSHCVSRFVEDFEVIDTIGRGSFGSVFKVLHRLDGCIYAVKRSRQHASREMKMQCMLNEVFALAALCSEEPSKHLLMYNSAWIEDDMLYIQTEICDINLEKWLSLRGNCDNNHHQQPANAMKEGPAAGKSVVSSEASISERRFPPLPYSEAKKLMRHISLALEIVHRRGMVHLDIAPKNIFLKGENFKLGDFGLVTRLDSVGDVMEGDARYMSPELLQIVSENVQLDKCDVFSLGITLYEVLSGRGLPHNGASWHHLRSGEALKPMSDCPVDLLGILHSCMHPDPTCRETATGLLQLPILQSDIELELHRQNQINNALRKELSLLKNCLNNKQLR